MSRAAVRLGYTQSAVSQQLRALERIVGVTLVTRSAGMRAVELTEAGRQLLAHADAIAGHLETARADLAAFSDGRVGELRIGAVPSAAARAGARARGRSCERAHRDSRSRSPSPTSPSELLDSLAAGELDLVVAPEDEPREGLESEAIMRDPYVALVPAGDPFLELGRPLTATDLTSRDLIGKDCAHRQPAGALGGALRLRTRRSAHPRPRPPRGAGARAPRPRDRGRAAAPARRARPDARDDPGRPLRAGPRDRRDDAGERRAHAGGRVRRRDPPELPRQSLMFSGRQACQSSTSIQADTRGLSRNGYGSPM